MVHILIIGTAMLTAVFLGGALELEAVGTITLFLGVAGAGYFTQIKMFPETVYDTICSKCKEHLQYGATVCKYCGNGQ